MLWRILYRILYGGGLAGPPPPVADSLEDIPMRMIDQTNRSSEITAVPTGTAAVVAEKVCGLKGFTLKVDGVVLEPSDKVPTGEVYEVVQCTTTPVSSTPEPADIPDEGL
jgi:hypothetical protein